jgi:deazaflavin-dependent oxidoreductase (nitroreductase family)
MTTFFDRFGQLHAWVYRHHGRLGRRFAWIPTLMLVSTGRNTGARRESVLLYADDGNHRVVVASNGGSDRPPGWLFNVRADPSVEVHVGDETYPAVAHIVDAEDPDYARLWKLVNSINGNRYDAYQAKTTRPIPLVALEHQVSGAETSTS